MNRTITERDAIDAAELAYLQLAGRTAVLARLAELLETVAGPNAVTVDFGDVSEEAFWFGIREITTGIQQAADTMRDAIGTLDKTTKAATR
jgi:hypothetical protein